MQVIRYDAMMRHNHHNFCQFHGDTFSLLRNPLAAKSKCSSLLQAMSQDRERKPRDGENGNYGLLWGLGKSQHNS